MIVVGIVLAAVARAHHPHVAAILKRLDAPYDCAAVNVKNFGQSSKSRPSQHVLLAVHVQANGDGYP
jgi:hypothetical protein